MDNLSHRQYVIDSLIWNGVITLLRPKKYSFTKIISLRSSKENSEIKCSKTATKLLTMPYPELDDINKTNTPTIKNLNVQDITYDENLDETFDALNTENDINDVILNDHKIIRLQDKIAELNKQEKLSNISESMKSWMDVASYNKKEVRLSSIEMLKKSIDNRISQIRHYATKKYIRTQKGVFAKFTDELHLMYHIEKACDFFYKSTGLDNFFVIIQSWPKRNYTESIYACYYIVDEISDNRQFNSIDF